MTTSRIAPFPRFYEYYLGEHRNPTCRPATFRQPWYSLAGDWVLWWQITTRRRSLSGRE